MADKFGRNYVLNVQNSEGNYVKIQPPLTVEFDITRNTLSNANSCSVSIYNLSKVNRSQLYVDQYACPNTRQINFTAGYGDSLYLIFDGWITRCYSVRQGNNFITSIECFDGGNAYVTAQYNYVFPAGTLYSSIVQELINSLSAYGVKPGRIGIITGITSRAYAVSGNTINSIIDIVGKNAFFIDNGVANVLGTTTVFNQSSVVPIISSGTGLLGTPTREETFLQFDMIFEPRLSLGSEIQLQSSTVNNYNSNYKIVSLHHKGMISDAVCGDAITTVGVFANSALIQAQAQA